MSKAPVSIPPFIADDRPSARSAVAVLLAVFLCGFALILALAATPASAITDSEELGRFGSEGAGSGQIGFGTNFMASDPLTGDLYLVDAENYRIDEFTAWGEFVKAFGWGVADGNGEPETCTTTCRKGLAGSGKGQIDNDAGGVAVENGGGIYALGSHRVQKFDSAGHFVLMFGAKVNKTTGGNICTAASGDECQSGAVGSGPGEFSEKDFTLAISQTGTVLVGGDGRIQEFEPDGSFKSAFKVSGLVTQIAPDPTGSDLYVTLAKEGTFEHLDDVHKLSPSGAELGSLKVLLPRAIAIDPHGNLYAIEHETLVNPSEPEKVIEFDSSGKELSSCCVPPLLPGQPEKEGVRYFQTALAANAAGDLYVATRAPGGGFSSYVIAYGPAPVKFGPPPPVPPEIDAQYATSVDSTSATLKAQINPRFWDDTRFYLEYGLESCASSACTQQPATPGVKLGAGAVKKAVTTTGVTLSGLQPGTTYHYRFVAQSSGGGPVRGVGGKVGTDGDEGTFTTFAVQQVPTPCTNDAFRTGPAAALPDCRAYEMVSPVDKNGGDTLALRDVTGWEDRLNQSSADGEALTYSSYRAFGRPEGGPYTAQYLARRSNEGWESEPLGGPLVGNFHDTNLGLENEFKAFSANLCESWVEPGADPTLAVGAIAGFSNLYRRENCPKSYEALTTVKPPNLTPFEYYPELQGYSADGAKAILQVKDNLSSETPAQPAQCGEKREEVYCHSRLYEASGGTLKLVCILPEGTPYAGNCSAGSPGERNTSTGRTASVSHAMSEDGSRIYWTASGEPSEPGKIYVRIDASTTLPVSEASGEGNTSKPSRFWGASADGAKALYEVADPSTAKNEKLYLYDLDAEEATLVAGKVAGVAAQSKDLSRVYFVSAEKIAGSGQNSGEEEATAGKPNLYLHEAGHNAFIATLSATDVGSKNIRIPSDASAQPVFHVASTTPDGARLAFISTEPLTGTDNTDIESGGADSEVFTYDATSGKLACASCSPAGARPAGRVIESSGAGRLQTDAFIPAAETELYTPRTLSNDGKRLFFTSYTDLLPQDTNGKADVYEWEAPGAGSCTEAGPDYHPANGGCLFLISSGESTSDSELIDTGANGSDVFFTTNASLLPQDTGLIDVYDARVDGGFSPPSAPAAACEGEVCQGAPVPPLDTTPASLAFSGPGNLIPPVLSTSKAKAKPRVKPCRKGTVRKKGRCVKQKRSARKGSAKGEKAGQSSRSVVKRNRRAQR